MFFNVSVLTYMKRFFNQFLFLCGLDFFLKHKSCVKKCNLSFCLNIKLVLVCKNLVNVKQKKIPFK